MTYYDVYYATHAATIFAGNNFNDLLRVDYFHLFSKGIFQHVLKNIIKMIDDPEYHLGSTATVTARTELKTLIDLRTASMPSIRGFSKRFVTLESGIFTIPSPWGFQLEAFFVIAPHIFTLEMLQNKGVLQYGESICLLAILVDLRTVSLSFEPLINRLFKDEDIVLLREKIRLLRSRMKRVLPNVHFYKNHWLTTILNDVLTRGVAQLDYQEQQHR